MIPHDTKFKRRNKIIECNNGMLRCITCFGALDALCRKSFLLINIAPHLD